MTTDMNKFRMGPIQGDLDLSVPIGANVHSCVVASDETLTLEPGDAVYLKDSATGVPEVLKVDADTIVPWGFVVRDPKKSAYVAGDRLQIARRPAVMFMVAGAAIARGARVEYDADNDRVITSAGVNPVCGYAYDKASALGDIIRVEFEAMIGDVSVADDLVVTNDVSIGGVLGITGVATFGSNVVKSVAAKSGAGAIPITASIVKLTTTGANALTLADGVDGQELSIIMIVDGGAGTLTPSNFGNGATLTFDDVGDSANLVFTNSKWYLVGTPTATLA